MSRICRRVHLGRLLPGGALLGCGTCFVTTSPRWPLDFVMLTVNYDLENVPVLETVVYRARCRTVSSLWYTPYVSCLFNSCNSYSPVGCTFSPLCRNSWSARSCCPECRTVHRSSTCLVLPSLQWPTCPLLPLRCRFCTGQLQTALGPLENAPGWRRWAVYRCFGRTPRALNKGGAWGWHRISMNLLRTVGVKITSLIRALLTTLWVKL